MDDDIDRDSAEYRALVCLAPALELAVKSQLTSLGAQFVAVGLITPDDCCWLIINPSLREDDQAANLIRLIKLKVHQDPQCYQKFINVLGKDQLRYSGIVGSLQRTVELIRRQPQSNTVDATPPSTASTSSIHFPLHCGREQ